MPSKKLILSGAPGNRGSASLLWLDTDGKIARGEVDTIALDEVINRVTDCGKRRVRLLKLDCEAAEFPILLTSRQLRWVDNICGEYHELSGQHISFPIPDHFKVAGVEQFSIEALGNALERAGFRVVTTRYQDTVFGLFFATRSRLTHFANQLLVP